MPVRRILALLLVTSLATAQDGVTMAQTPPSASDAARYTGLLAAAYEGDADEARRLIAAGSDLEIADGWGRTPLHVAAFRSGDEVVSVLAEAGADMNALDSQAYDIVTIAAVANDPKLVRHALSLGASPANVTSLYDGTALIAADSYLEITDDWGRTPLHVAAFRSDDDIVSVSFYPLEGSTT